MFGIVSILPSIVSFSGISLHFSTTLFGLIYITDMFVYVSSNCSKPISFFFLCIFGIFIDLSIFMFVTFNSSPGCSQSILLPFVLKLFYPTLKKY